MSDPCSRTGEDLGSSKEKSTTITTERATIQAQHIESTSPPRLSRRELRRLRRAACGGGTHTPKTTTTDEKGRHKGEHRNTDCARDTYQQIPSTTDVLLCSAAPNTRKEIRHVWNRFTLHRIQEGCGTAGPTPITDDVKTDESDVMNSPRKQKRRGERKEDVVTNSHCATDAMIGIEKPKKVLPPPFKVGTLEMYRRFPQAYESFMRHHDCSQVETFLSQLLFQIAHSIVEIQRRREENTHSIGGGLGMEPFPTLPALRVMDLGCGTGRVESMLARHPAVQYIYAYDKEMNMLPRCLVSTIQSAAQAGVWGRKGSVPTGASAHKGPNVEWGDTVTSGQKPSPPNEEKEGERDATSGEVQQGRTENPRSPFQLPSRFRWERDCVVLLPEASQTVSHQRSEKEESYYMDAHPVIMGETERTENADNVTSDGVVLPVWVRANNTALDRAGSLAPSSCDTVRGLTSATATAAAAAGGVREVASATPSSSSFPFTSTSLPSSTAVLLRRPRWTAARSDGMTIQGESTTQGLSHTEAVSPMAIPLHVCVRPVSFEHVHDGFLEACSRHFSSSAQSATSTKPGSSNTTVTSEANIVAAENGDSPHPKCHLVVCAWSLSYVMRQQWGEDKWHATTDRLVQQLMDQLKTISLGNRDTDKERGEHTNNGPTVVSNEHMSPISSKAAVVIIETLGHGVETPSRQSTFTQRLENVWGFERHWVRTDYRFDSVEDAVAYTHFFFGKAVAQDMKEKQSTLLPECTGIWIKWK